MARYFFHLVDGLFLPDSKGEEFETVDAAKCHAIEMAAKAALERGDRFWSGEGLRLVVTDAGGEMQFQVHFSGRLGAPGA